jgi:hypothetical protein
VPKRRFPPPWTVEELDACFIVTDGGGQKWTTFISRMSRAGDLNAVLILLRLALRLCLPK